MGNFYWEKNIRFSFSQFLTALILLFLTGPYVQQLEYGRLIETALTTLVMLSAILAIGGRGGSLVAALLLALPLFASQWIHHCVPFFLPEWIRIVAGIAFIGFVAARLLNFIFQMRKIDAESICAAISAYIMIGILWGMFYSLVELMQPGAFVFTAGPSESRAMTPMNGIYFSFVTLATIGYGDIIPVSSTARMMAIMEATSGMFYVTVLISRLVSLYTSACQNAQAERCDCGKHG